VESYYVYILENARGQFYIGQTDDLETRVANHNRTDKISGKFTRKNGPWTLVWSEQHLDRSTAMHREREIKSWKSSRFIRKRLLRCDE
jgi:putative endonuclease